jgi:putative pyruvate formate lyase activating enzyme
LSGIQICTTPRKLQKSSRIVDVYLGDFKYGNNVCAREYSKIKNYLDIMQPNFEFAYEIAEILL